MKVSTDACIQGAWAPIPVTASRVLDIGCGTGLLSIMIAQRRSDVIIDALEADPLAAEQAMENVAISPWKGSIQVRHMDARDYAAPQRYDMIICNPPFFSGDLQARDSRRNRARHDVSLSQTDLFQVLQRNLRLDGIACIMLPVAEHALWEALIARQGWYIHRSLSVRPTAGKQVNRVISTAAAFPGAAEGNEVLTIYDTTGGYTERFRELLNAYYLFVAGRWY